MKIHFTLTNVASGPFFRVSGKLKPDKYLFERVPGANHLHRMTIDAEDAPAVFDDLALRTQQLDIPVGISIEMEKGDLGTKATKALIQEKEDVIVELNRKLEAGAVLIRNMEKKVREIPKVAPKAGRITSEQLEQLQERDELLEAIRPFAGDDETPLQVLIRITTAISTVAEPVPVRPASEPEPEPATPEQPPQPAEAPAPKATAPGSKPKTIRSSIPPKYQRPVKAVKKPTKKRK